MKESIKTVFQCDFCDKRLFRKDAMIRHEKGCICNPLNQDACLGCIHCARIDIKYIKDGYFDGYFIETERTVSGFECKKLEQKLYPHKCLNKGMLEKYPDTFEGQNLMPNECEHFEIFG